MIYSDNRNIKWFIKYTQKIKDIPLKTAILFVAVVFILFISTCLLSFFRLDVIILALSGVVVLFYWLKLVLKKEQRYTLLSTAVVCVIVMILFINFAIAIYSFTEYEHYITYALICLTLLMLPTLFLTVLVTRRLVRKNYYCFKHAKRYSGVQASILGLAVAGFGLKLFWISMFVVILGGEAVCIQQFMRYYYVRLYDYDEYINT